MSRSAPDRPRPNSAQAQPDARRWLVELFNNGKLPALGLLLGAGWLLYASLTSPSYVVQQLQLEGASALTQTDAAALAGVQGQPVWQIKAPEVAARIEQSPYVARAEAQVLLPATVVVRVQEVQPAIRWQHAEVAYDVAQDGRVLAATSAASLARLPATVGLSQTSPLSTTATQSSSGAGAASTLVVFDETPNRPITPGAYVDPDALEVARLLGAYATELPLPVERLVWKSNEGMSLTMGGKAVVLGRSDRLLEKMAILKELVNTSAAFSFVDLRPSTPYFR